MPRKLSEKKRQEAAALISDLTFTLPLHEHWLRELQAAGLTADAAAEALAPLMGALNSARTKYGISAEDFWRALLRGHATFATLAIFSAGTRTDA